MFLKRKSGRFENEILKNWWNLRFFPPLFLITDFNEILKYSKEGTAYHFGQNWRFFQYLKNFHKMLKNQKRLSLWAFKTILSIFTQSLKSSKNSWIFFKNGIDDFSKFQKMLKNQSGFVLGILSVFTQFLRFSKNRQFCSKSLEGASRVFPIMLETFLA